jgi:hypothetical protein
MNSMPRCPVSLRLISLMKDEVRTANTPTRDMQNTKNIRWNIG